MQLEDWLDDLCVRFIINLPPEELVSVERICFQVEEAQWFYEDFIRPLDPSLPSLPLKAFSLRIFQHCPLFATWSTHHYTSAFAEFLAYKQRVPVRGAIMLNEEMDEVVLVKGWKKGANWSFPRGKINKDEHDLDCAIREVLEETGYDIRAAGLVKSESDMKYIEITMREQHMRLYVFRGVPKDTHFEPMTRKEISKIEWYKLTDLPTLKKKQNHLSGQDESAALSANKFYMVAPFLHPLKKWIAQQKKRESRYGSSHLAAPPMMVDDSATEGEPGPVSYQDGQPTTLSPAIPSSLPEVATTSNFLPLQDPSQHLKELLNIGTKPPSTIPATQLVSAADIGAAKSDALLSLLRNGSVEDTHSNSRTPVEHPSLAYQASSSLLRPDSTQISVASTHQPAPLGTTLQSQLPDRQQSLLDLFAKADVSSRRAMMSPSSSDYISGIAQNAPERPLTSYQNTEDPHSARSLSQAATPRAISPENDLPKLTQHTRALLDAFRTTNPPPARQSQSAQKVIQPPLAPTQQVLLDTFKTARHLPTQPPQSVQKTAQSSLAPTQQALLDAFRTMTPTLRPKPAMTTDATALLTASGPPDTKTTAANKNDYIPKSEIHSSDASSLLNLFQNTTGSASGQTQKTTEPLQAPAELAAGPMLSPRFQSRNQPEALSSVSRRDAPKRVPQATRAGETGATVDGPLNQPHFDSITRSPSQLSSDSMHRSPVPAHRTLYDPKQNYPTRILQRPEESKKGYAKSPRQPKATVGIASPKQKTRSQPERLFQPQILRRPQGGESRDSLITSPASPAILSDVHNQSLPSQPLAIDTVVRRQTSTISPPKPVEIIRRGSHQMESQKQNLLSLLTGQSSTIGVNKPTDEIPTSGTISPLTQNQIVSPLVDDTPISTRSRIDSVASISTIGGTHEARGHAEKRQTTADDKAFLLGYLGRIASQGSHT